jgi:hypothetical protein
MSYDYEARGRELLNQITQCEEKEADALITAALKEAAAQAYEDAADTVRDLHEGEECSWSGEDGFRAKASALRLGGGK